MATRKRGQALPVRGYLEDDTEAGFGRLLQKANAAYEDGLILIAVVPIGPAKIGGVFVRVPEGRGGVNLLGD